MTIGSAARIMNQRTGDRNGLPVERLKRDTLHERVYRQVSDLILDGEIAPGQSVTVQALAEAFGVSAMPVREALKQLTAAKALTTLSGRSIGIPPLNAERLSDLRNVRMVIEGQAAIWAMNNITGTEIEELETCLLAMKRATAQGDVKSYLRCNRRFHFLIYQASHSDTLLSIIESLWLQISPYFNMLHGSGNYDQANQEHDAMLHALKARDGEGLMNAVRADIQGAYDVLMGLLD